MTDLNDLSYLQIGYALLTGIILGIVYLFLLWQTLLKLPSIKQKGLFLFLSAAIRLTMLIFVALHFSYESGGRFLIIIIGFILTRLVVTKYVKASIQKEYETRSKKKENTPQKSSPAPSKQINRPKKDKRK
ncbi:MAG: hypothetical protein IKY98_02730 [Alphaproteobacteria bacterium]|nr:hypothetical protein [Alphaproteobacteria bacterium]